MIDNEATSSFGTAFSDCRHDSVSAGFSVENICGEGASCEVYRMRLGGLRVAVKRLREEYRTNPTFVASYRKEFQVGQRLKHDALPVYRDFHDGHDEVYIVMDYVDGVSLEGFVATAEGKEYLRSADNARSFLAQLLDVVGYLHRSGVIHCDIKPANIMLRHSDRSPMLLDLDKAYCDTLDLTHGGTSAFSETLSNGEIPTAKKDFAAIGRLVDFLSGKIPGFPGYKFKRFRKMCTAEGVSAVALQKSLERSSRAISHVAIAVVLLAGIILTVAIWRGHGRGIEQRPTVHDTIVTIIKGEPAQEPRQPPTPASQPIAIDFDAAMADFDREAQGAIEALASGRMSDSEVRETLYALLGDYSAAYDRILAHAKAVHPGQSGIEVEMAVAREAEQSRALRLLQQYSKAAADTLHARQSALHDNLQ